MNLPLTSAPLSSIKCWISRRYLDRSDNENELKQVLGELVSAFDIGDDDVLIIGRDGTLTPSFITGLDLHAAGMLLSGPNCKLFESQIMQYVSLLARELCIRNYFLRLFVLDDTLKKVMCPRNCNRVCLMIILQLVRCGSWCRRTRVTLQTFRAFAARSTRRARTLYCWWR